MAINFATFKQWSNETMKQYLNNLTIKKASELLDKKEITSTELVNYYLDRIKKIDPEIGAYLLVCEKYALKKAQEADERIKTGKRKGILDGIPYGVKDLIITYGIETTAASKILKGFIPPFSATVIEKLEEAGAIILGKTNCDEFGMGSSCENSAYKKTYNPWNRAHVPGGSSGGSAAALSADLCVFALGTDTGGSIRQPASFCSVVGLKPTYGRVSRYGAIPYGSSLDQIGPMGKSVDDVGIILGVIAGRDRLDSTTVDKEFSIFNPQVGWAGFQFSMKDIKIGIPKEYFGEGLDKEVEGIIKEAIEQFKKLGAEIIDISLPYTEYAIPTYYLIAMAEASSNLARYDGIKYGASVPISNPQSPIPNLLDVYFKTRGEYFGEEPKRKIILGTFELSHGYYDAYYKRAQQVRSLIKEDFDKAFEKIDIVLTPVSPFPPFKIGEKKEDPLSMYLSDVYTVPANLAGICGLSIPVGFTKDKLPVGLQILGPRFGEEKILGIAKEYEKATEWHEMFPENGN